MFQNYLFETRQKPWDRAKVWKKSKKKKLKLARKNYSKSNEKCMLLEFPIPMSKFFSIFIQKNARNDSKSSHINLYFDL